MTPCYILKRSLTKVNLLNTPDTWGGYLKKQGHHKTSPLLTMTSCYILKQISTKANLLDSPNTGGGVGLSHKPDYHKTLTSTFPLTIMWCYIQNDLLQTSTSSIPPTVGGWLSHKPDYHKTPPPLLTMMSCYILKQTSTKVNLLNSPNKNPKVWGLWVTIVAPLIFDQRLKKHNLQSKTNKQTKTQGLLVTSWSCFPLTSSPAPYLLPFPKRWYHTGQQKVREHGSGALRKWQTKVRKWCKLGKGKKKEENKERKRDKWEIRKKDERKQKRKREWKGKTTRTKYS